MNDISELIKLFANNTQEQKDPATPIPKELIEQYPYGEFPIRYTKGGQETIRKNSEARFSYSETTPPPKDSSNNLDISTILALSTLFSSKKKQPKDMFELFSSLLFKDKPELKKLIGLISKVPTQKEVSLSTPFPDTQTVCISSLKRVE
ncbi:MAG: hypothetical protein E7354_00755 [Clostridiales bacterium]|nr:hypothetical protein [Clostridiales bacterium]